MRIIDMHCDTISEILERRKKGQELSLRNNNLMIDLNRMKQGNYSVQNFALFVEQEKGVSSFDKVKELLAVFQGEMKANRDLISQVTTTDEILENERGGRVSALLTVEGGEACEGSLENLHYLYQQGVRMMTLTWNFPNELGCPNFSEETDCYTPDTTHGLTPTGIRFVEEMERLNMIIDVSHLSDAGFYDVLHHTKKPFVASHSNARTVCPWVRNLTDDMIKKLAERGGVTGLNYCGDFLRDPFSDAERAEIMEKGLAAFAGNRAQPDSAATLEDITRHARHIVNVGGIECLGLGSDFDGIPSYAGCPKADRMTEFADMLMKTGFHESEVDKIFYGNVFRLYREVLG